MSQSAMSSRVRKWGGFTATALAVLFAAVIGAAPAQAAPQNYCGLGKACVWDDPDYNTNGNYAGLLWFEYYVTPMSNYVYNGTGISAGDTADSWYNNGRSSTACFYDGANYYAGPGGDRARCLVKGSGDGNIENSAGIIQGVTWDPNSAKFV